MDEEKILKFMNEGGMNEEEAKSLLEEVKELGNSLKDIPQMKRIQETLDEKFLNMLMDVNGYLIDEMQKAKSNMAKESIEEMIKNNFKLIVKIKEKKGEIENGKKI